jgi:predicted ATPase
MAVYEGLDFDSIELQEVNLFVGISGSGKSQLLASLFNVARFAIGSEKRVVPYFPFLGEWKIDILIDKKKYIWTCKRENTVEKQGLILQEQIDLSEDGKSRTLVKRTNDKFTFDGSDLPKLDATTSCIELLRDEDKIKPLFQGFTNVIVRNFSGELGNVYEYTSIDKSQEGLFTNPATFEQGRYLLFSLPLNLRLYFIHKFFKKEYQSIIDSLKELFPEILECHIVDGHKEKILISPGTFTPVFVINEKNVKKRIPFKDLSSGMRKVLLILTDILTMPSGFIYELDEYENSLGVNVIDFLPTLLLEHQKSKQFLITTHHPYLINKMPVKNWYVLGRVGTKVRVKYGKELLDSYGKSHQDAFIQLINDPFYSPENK